MVKVFGNDDYIRVGKVVAGKESTRARNRLFRVGGAEALSGGKSVKTIDLGPLAELGSSN